MNDGEELSAERGRALRARHPLYARLNGEVVWMLYEELGWDAGQCGRYMDRFLADMQAALAVMDAVEQAPQRRFRIAGRTLPDGREECCPGCPCRQLPWAVICAPCWWQMGTTAGSPASCPHRQKYCPVQPFPCFVRLKQSRIPQYYKHSRGKRQRPAQPQAAASSGPGRRMASSGKKSPESDGKSWQ